jgi:hypothetical protein
MLENCTSAQLPTAACRAIHERNVEPSRATYIGSKEGSSRRYQQWVTGRKLHPKYYIYHNCRIVLYTCNRRVLFVHSEEVSHEYKHSI